MQCQSVKRDGARCSLPARGSGGFCWAHDPQNAQKRRETASKAGKAKGPSGEILEVKKEIRRLVDDVVEGRVDRGKASVAFQGLGILRGYLEIEHKRYEAEVLEKRIAELERAQAERDTRPNTRGGMRW